MKTNRPKNSALMIFSLSAAVEGREKHYFGRHQRSANRRLQSYLCRKTTTLVRNIEVDVVWIDEQEQRGNTFGERFTNAFADLFAQGYERVLAIGNDCPELSAAVIQRALQALRNQVLVLGPALDGGDYLIGLAKADFDANALAALPWTTPQLHHALLNWAEAHQKTITCLEVLSDIDDLSSLREYASGNPNSSLAKLVDYYLGQQVHWKDFSYAVLQECLRTSQAQRGPPAPL